MNDVAAAEPRLARLLVRAALVLVAGAVLYAGLSVWSGPGAALELRRLSLERWGLVLALVAFGFALRALRWQLYTRHLGLSLPPFENAWVFLASFAFTATPGKAGEVVKSFLLKQRFGVPLVATAAALLVERLIDLLAVLALSLAGLSLPGARPYFALCALVLLLGFGFVVSERSHRWVLGNLQRFARLRAPATTLLRLLAAGRTLLHGRPFAWGLGLSVIAWSCEALALFVILRALGVAATPLFAAAVFGLATLVGALSMLPGGLGGFEGTMVLVLAGQGASRGSAVAATLLLRAATLWFATVLGAALLVWWWLGHGRLRSALSSGPSGGRR